MTIADPPRASPSPAQMIRAARAAGDGRALFHGVSWATYEATLDAVGDGLPRLSYDGTLELEMPSDLHELLESTAGDFLINYMQEFEIDFLPVGSMTLRQEPKRGGLEGVQSYYVQHYRDVVGRRLGPDVEPTPDLAIEIDESRPSARKASIYARLGVPELWRWRDGRLVVLARVADAASPDGFAYVERERSLALPGVPLERLAAELARTPHAGQAAAARAFRAWCREQAARRA